KVPPPKVDVDAPFQMQVSAIDYSSYVGAIGIGRVTRGTIKPNTQITVIDAQGKTRNSRILQLFQTIGFDRREIPMASASYIVSGRGELHLSILIENMRREGFELSVSRPKVIQKEIDGVMCEPYEQLIIDVEEKDQGTIMQYLADRQGELKHMMPDGKGRVRL